MDIISILVDPVTIFVLILIIALLVFLLEGFVIIRDDQVGIKIRKIFGNPMPQGQIIARNPDDVGIQADTLMPKLYWFNPITWRIKKTKIVEIPQGKIGLVEAIDGEPLPHGRLLGDHIECNSFQDAKAFLDGHGRRGPQIEILRPGFYRINTELFSIAPVDDTVITEEQIGILVSQDGKTLPSGFVIAPKPVEKSGKDHKFFQNGQDFIELDGYRGPQLDTLQPGEYYINPMQFEVKKVSLTDVPPGYVAVIRSNVGKELAKSDKRPTQTKKVPDYEQPIHEAEEVVLTTDQNERGIWIEPVAPGKYNLNTLAFTAYLVPTSAVTIDWASGAEIRAEHLVDGEREETSEEEKAREFFRFSQLRVTSKDGFQLEVDVRMIIRIRPQHASFIIARFGSVANLIEQIVHPLIDSSFRNKAGEKKAIDFIMSRTDLQKEALEKARDEFSQYHVEAQNLLIAYIKVDEALLATQTNKEIAIQQQTQYEQQALAQEKRIAVKEKEARAEKQKDVIDAKLSVEIKKDLADAMRRESEGIRDKTRAIADGDAYQSIKVGEGIAKAYEAQATVIGPQILGLLKTFEKISDGQIKIVPDVLVTGDSKDGGNNLVSALIAMLVKEGALTFQSQPKRLRSKPHPSTVEEKGKSLPSLPVETTEPPYCSPVLDPEPLPERIAELDSEIEEEANKKREQQRQPFVQKPSRSSPRRTPATRTQRSS